MTIRAICWDWNGTLLDDVDVCRQVMDRVLVAYGCAPFADRAAYRAAFRFPIRRFYADAGLGDDVYREAAAQYLDWLDERIDTASLHPGVESVLAAVAALGIRQVLASATVTAALARQLAPHSAVRERFEETLSISDPYGASKRDVIAAWVATTALQPHEVLMIGDTNHDREIAADLGTGFVHFDAGHQSAPDAVTRIGSLPELIPHLAAQA